MNQRIALKLEWKYKFMNWNWIEVWNLSILSLENCKQQSCLERIYWNFILKLFSVQCICIHCTCNTVHVNFVEGRVGVDTDKPALNISVYYLSVHSDSTQAFLAFLPCDICLECLAVLCFWGAVFFPWSWSWQVSWALRQPIWRHKEKHIIRTITDMHVDLHLVRNL